MKENKEEINHGGKTCVIDSAIAARASNDFN